MATTSGRTSRSRKSSARKRLVSPSTASLHSNMTKVSSGSNDSNATITQESVSRARRRSLKEHTSRKEASCRRPDSRSARRSPAMSPIAENEKPNVFAFLEEDVDGISIRSGDIPPDSSTTPRELMEDIDSPSASSSPEQVFSVKCLHAPEHYYHRSSRSAPSDSGISVRSGSSDGGSPVLRHERPRIRAAVRSSQSTRGVTHTPSVSPAPGRRFLHPFHEGHPTHPDAYGADERGPPYHDSRSLASLDLGGGKETAMTHQRTGYDLLAASISHSGADVLKPIYRKFETLNNRVLLWLQDEIGELEERLGVIDMEIAHWDKANGVGTTSRRRDGKMPTHLHYRRMEAMGQVHVKLDQYNRTLASYGKLCGSLGATAATDVDAYKVWMAQHQPIVQEETAFLDQLSDLTTVSAQQRDGPLSSSGRPTIATGFFVLITILAFKIVPQFANRLVIGMTLGLAMTCSASPSLSLDPARLQEYRRRASIYALIIVTLAIAVG